MPWLPDLHTPEEDLVFFRDGGLSGVHDQDREGRSACGLLRGFAKNGWTLYIDPIGPAVASAQFC
jgi:hypothetical protein